MELLDLLETLPKNKIVVDNFIIAYSKINSPMYKKIMCSISGGADSDDILDICSKCDIDHKIEYVFFDTGLEYEATKEHLKYLEEKYNIEIKVEKAKVPIPVSCKNYGQPFISKLVSEMIDRLQKHGFQWEDEPLEALEKKYKHCRRALRWWCNDFGEKSRFNINYNKWLKEFMLENHIDFEVSNYCCTGAKKDVAHDVKTKGNYDLSIVGVRKSEGGVRSSAYKNCFTPMEDEPDEYRPIFFYKNDDKKEYDEACDITHSRCYTEYGLPRTGCAGCPYGRDFENELKVMKEHEPKLHVAANNIFKDSYEYTRKYRRFAKQKNIEQKENANK